MTGSTPQFGLGYMLLKRLCEEQSTLHWHNYKLIPAMFRPGEQEVLSWINQHVVSHHVLPHPDTLAQMFPDIKQFPTVEPGTYYLKHIENRLYYERINQANIDSQSVLKDNPGNYQKAMEAMTETLAFIAGHQFRQRIVDLAKEGPKMVMNAYHNVLNNEVAGTFGWPHMDDAGGGMMPGDVISFVGRPACLSGDSKIWVSRKKDSSGRYYTLKELHHRFNGGKIPIGLPGKSYKRWNPNIETHINSLNDKGFTQLNEVMDVMYSGKKVTYTVTTNSGKIIRTTMDHRFKTATGFSRLSELAVGDTVICRAPEINCTPAPKRKSTKEVCTKLPYSPYRTRVVSGGIYNRVSIPRLNFDANANGVTVEQFMWGLKNNPDHGFVFSDPKCEIHHRDRDSENNDPSNLACLTTQDHNDLHTLIEGNGRRYGGREVQGEVIVSIEYHGVEDTYDISMNAPFHNFVADDFVVHNSGKAQPLTSKVLTIGGFKFMGDIKVGDKLASVDGQPSVVTGVFPQGKKPVFTLTFQDGRTVEASDEHLWEVYNKRWLVPKVMSTLQLIAWKSIRNGTDSNSLFIRQYSGDFGQKVESPFSAYLLGVFLGDGCLRSGTPSLTSVDPEILSRIGSELTVSGLELSTGWGRGGIQYSASDTRMGTCAQENRLRKWFKDLGVWGLKSEHKHIPAQYLEADRETRVQLLQGLMDTDGTADKTNGTISFSSSSKTLAEQVQYLVRSIGGSATLKFKETSCLDHWRVFVSVQDRAAMFSLTRKKELVSRPRERRADLLRLDTIEYLGDDECQCIQVSHPSHLYVSDDFVVTHNTFMLLRMALSNWEKGHRPLVVSMEMSPLPLIQRLTAMYAHTNLGQLKTGGYSTTGEGGGTYGKFIGSMLGLSAGPSGFYVVDGNLAASVDDIYTLAVQLKCDQVYIDGAYLLKHPNNRLDRYTKVAENVELIKQRTTALEVPTVCSYQFARTAKKGGKNGKSMPNEEAGLEDIGMSDSIPQISSIVLGLFQEESVETMETRKIRVMKGRSGETGSFTINWNFDTLDFSQCLPENLKIDDPNAKLMYL